MKKKIGIILKKYQPQKKTICVLDSELGKIKCIPNIQSIQNIVLGSLIQYYITNNRSPYFISSISSMEIIHIPFDIAISDITFLHHILEVCNQFIPINSPAEEIFILISYLYLSSHKIKCKMKKKLFLFKLFTLLGIYPEGEKFQTLYFYKLATESIDTIISKNLNLESEKNLDNWLQYCLKSQPEFSNFKTVNFLYKKQIG